MALNNTPPLIPTDKSTDVGTNQEFLCDTQVKLNTISHTWSIRNFEFCTNVVGKSVKSPTFPQAFDRKPQWILKIYPNGNVEENKGNVSVYLTRVRNETPETFAGFKLSLLNSKMQKFNTLTSEVHKFTNTSSSWGYGTFIKRYKLLDDKDQLMPNETLTIFCEITSAENIVHTSTKVNETHFQMFKLIDDLCGLFENKQYTDFTITINQKEFQVHKGILAMRSPVFSAMFNADMKEENMSNVDIPDVDYEVMEEMLRFVYTGKVKDIGKVADRLLAAADKYALEELKLMCEEALQAAITVNNAADTLILADLHSAKSLKETAIDFICKHCKLVLNTSGYETIIKSYPYLLAEAFQELSMRVNRDANEATPAKDTKESKETEKSC